MISNIKIKSRDITIIFQGQETPSLKENICKTIVHFPEARVIISLIEHSEEKQHYEYTCVYSKDPNELPNFKYNKAKLVNNINRQIVSTATGLSLATTKYSIKIRSDAYLENNHFLKFYSLYNGDKEDRIIFPCFFSLDPNILEHMPFHLSDWFQFSKTDTLQRLWSTPLMSIEDATYYDRHPFQDKSSYFDKQYRSRYAPEQYIIYHFASQEGYTTPNYHNDCREEVLNDHERFLKEKCIILNLEQISLKVPKYKKITNSGFQYLNCIFFDEWLSMAQHITTETKQLQRKKKMRSAFIKATPIFNQLMPILKKFRLLIFFGIIIQLIRLKYCERGKGHDYNIP